MRTTLLTILALLSASGYGFAQTATGAAPAAGAATPPAGVEADADALKVKERLEQERAKRLREKADLEQKLSEAKMRLQTEKSRIVEFDKQVSLIDRDLTAAKERKEQAFKELEGVTAEYKDAERKDRDDFIAKIIAALQSLYDGEFRKQKAAYERDMDFIARNRWSPDDFNGLTIPMDPEDRSKALTFDGKAGTVSGSFATLEFSTGAKTWRALPPGTRYTGTIQKENAFVAEAAIRPNADFLGSGSTNLLDWGIRVFIAKDFAKPAGDPARFRLVGVNWPVDLAHRLCWQRSAPPVFEPTPMPEARKATTETPEIASQIKAWAFANDTLIQRLKEAQNAVKTHTVFYERAVARKPAQVSRIERKVEEIKEKIKEEEKRIKDIESMLEEYREDAPPATPPAAADVPAAKPPAATEGL